MEKHQQLITVLQGPWGDEYCGDAANAIRALVRENEAYRNALKRAHSCIWRSRFPHLPNVPLTEAQIDALLAEQKELLKL
jgi:hypothetical protein